MTIKGAIQFSDFVSAHGLADQDSLFRQIVNCTNNFKAACNCYNKEDKLRMYDTCNRLYSEAVRNVIPKLKMVVLSKIPERQISFYYDRGDLIKLITY